MTFVSGTITTGVDADLYNVIATALASNGLILVDTQVISTRTHRVWKNPASNNSLGKDWYYDISYPTSGQAGITIHPFEDYDAVNHLGIRGCVPIATYTPETTYYSRYGATGYALETNWIPSTSYQITTSASSYGYRLSITPDRIIGTTTAANTALIYAGLIDLSNACAAAAGASAFPIICLSGTTVNQTRYPKANSFIQSGQQSVLNPPTTNDPAFPSGNFTTLSPSLRNISVQPSGSAASSQPAGWDGFLKDVYSLRVDNTVNQGDTFTYGSDTYYIAGNLTAQANAYVIKQA